MCGIAGCYQQADGDKLVDVMNDRIAHRGPDARASAPPGGPVAVQLGHRRLSIIDLSPEADQPFAKGRAWLSLQRRALQLQGVAGRTRRAGRQVSSTNRTPRWSLRLGAAGARRAAALSRHVRIRLFDEHTGRLVLARDQLGIKPLYYLPRGDGVVFASELKALVARWARATGRARRTGRFDALLLDTDSVAPSTASRSCPPGHGQSSGRTALHGPALLGVRRWRPRRPPGLRSSCAGHRGLRHRAPRRRCPVSSFLSGGLDSSIVTVLAKRHNPEIDAYTIAFRREDQRLEAMPDDAGTPARSRRSSD